VYVGKDPVADTPMTFLSCTVALGAQFSRDSGLTLRRRPAFVGTCIKVVIGARLAETGPEPMTLPAPLLKMLLPLWAVAFVAGFVLTVAR
jgi:hypothetical protein